MREEASRTFIIRIGRSVPARTAAVFAMLAVIAYEALRGRDSFAREVGFIALDGMHEIHISGRYAEQFAALLAEFAVRLGGCCGDCRLAAHQTLISIE